MLVSYNVEGFFEDNGMRDYIGDMEDNAVLDEELAKASDEELAEASDGELAEASDEVGASSEEVIYNATAANIWYQNRHKPNSQRFICTIGRQINKICGFKYPLNIRITEKGIVYVTEYGTNYIHILNTAGNRLKKFAIPRGRPTGMFIRRNVMYVTNHKDEVLKFTLNGEYLGMHYVRRAVTISVALDYDDLMYVSDWHSRNVRVFHRDGTASHVISYSGMRPRKLLFDGNGNLYVSDHYRKVLYVFNKYGKLLRKISVPTKLTEGFTMDRVGNLFVPDRTRNAGKLVILNKSGNVLKTIGGMVGASDVAIAPDGTIWVVDFEGNCLLHY